MKSAFAPVVAAVVFAASAAAQLMINTPANPPECEPALITWTAGTPPYFVSILPGNQPNAAALISFPSTTALSITWTVNITANTQLGLNLRDNTGTVVQSGVFTVQPGTTSCLTASGGSSSSSGSATGSGTVAPSTPASAPTTTPVTTPVTTPGTTPVSTPTTPATSKSSSASPSTTSAPPASAAVSAHTLNLGLATAMGAVLFALVMA